MDENDGEDDFVCFQEEEGGEEETKNKYSAGCLFQNNSESNDECSYDDDDDDDDDSSSLDGNNYSDEDDLEVIPQSSDPNTQLIETLMEIENSQVERKIYYPSDEICEWFRNEDNEQIEEIFKIYTENLDQEKHLKNFKRGMKSFIASIKRELVLSSDNKFQTFDTILIFRKDTSKKKKKI